MGGQPNPVIALRLCAKTDARQPRSKRNQRKAWSGKGKTRYAPMRGNCVGVFSGV